MSSFRAPKAQPPGKETCAFPMRANKGPNTQNPARILLSNS